MIKVQEKGVNIKAFISDSVGEYAAARYTYI